MDLPLYRSEQGSRRVHDEDISIGPEGLRIPAAVVTVSSTVVTAELRARRDCPSELVNHEKAVIPQAIWRDSILSSHSKSIARRSMPGKVCGTDGPDYVLEDATGGCSSSIGSSDWTLDRTPSGAWFLKRHKPRRSQTPLLKPRLSFLSLASLDNLITYRKEKEDWAGVSSILHSLAKQTFTESNEDTSTSAPQTFSTYGAEGMRGGLGANAPPYQPSRFRSFAAELMFCFTVAMTQFLAEYLISGFALHLSLSTTNVGSTGQFWSASLLCLTLSASLLTFARICDMCGGYFPFVLGLLWLSFWSMVAGISSIPVLVNVSRAMQGIAIAAFTPATFTIVDSIYPQDRRKNIVLGLYAGCAPLGFFAGFMIAGALPVDHSNWYFLIAAILSLITAITAYLSIPHDGTNRKTLDLQMDWLGSLLITSGLILVAYSLAVEPYAGRETATNNGFATSMVLGPLVSGLGCLCIAVWVEGWLARSPLLPFDFFAPRSVPGFAVACLFFYAAYAVWLYESADFFRISLGGGGGGGSSSSSAESNTFQGIVIAMGYLPMVLGGVALCVGSGALLHTVPPQALLLLSGVAWIAAPLLLALAPAPPQGYWAFAVPSMLCATAGIDLTFTLSLVFLSAVQPRRYQGLTGAVCSVLVNLAMSFALSIAEIVKNRAQHEFETSRRVAGVVIDVEAKEVWGLRAAFIYAALSAGVGFAICTMCVKVPRNVTNGKQASDEDVSASV